MSDPIDQANDHIERETAVLLKARKPSGPAATGYCLFCDEPVGTGQRWCDAECRDGWEADHKAARYRVHE